MLGAVRNAARPAARQGVRYMSGSNIAEETKEMNKWRIVTYIAIPLSFAKAFIDLSGSHPEHKEAPNYPYMHIRHKDFPWGEDGLFEVKKH